MPEEPEKSGQEPNLELPSLLGFGRKKKKNRKTDTVADAPATDEVAAEEPAPPPEPGSAAESDDPSTADPVPQARAGLAPATDRPKRKPPVPPPPATRAEPGSSRSRSQWSRPNQRWCRSPRPSQRSPRSPRSRRNPNALSEPEPVIEPEPVVEPEPQVSRDTEGTKVIENVPPQAAVAAPVEESAAEPVAEPVPEPVTEQQPAVAGGPASAAQQNRPVHEGRVSWNDEEPEAQPVPGGQPASRCARRAGWGGSAPARTYAATAAGDQPAPRCRAHRRRRRLGGCGLTTVAGRGCEVIRGVGSCGGIGLLALLVILVLEILLGAVLLKAWRLTDPTSTSFLGVGLAAVFVMLFLLQLTRVGVDVPRDPVAERGDLPGVVAGHRDLR